MNLNWKQKGTKITALRQQNDSITQENTNIEEIQENLDTLKTKDTKIEKEIKSFNVTLLARGGQIKAKNMKIVKRN